jgi:hypothetical protein
MILACQHTSSSLMAAQLAILLLLYSFDELFMQNIESEFMLPAYPWASIMLGFSIEVFNAFAL